MILKILAFGITKDILGTSEKEIEIYNESLFNRKGFLMDLEKVLIILNKIIIGIFI